MDGGWFTLFPPAHLRNRAIYLDWHGQRPYNRQWLRYTNLNRDKENVDVE